MSATASTTAGGVLTPPAQAPVISIPPTILPLRPREYYVIGCGGTGGRIVPALVKILGDGDRVFLIDGDRVESHNLLRQHFVDADVGRYKAEVLAERYSLPGGPTLTPKCAMIQSRDWRTELGTVTRESFAHAVVIGCVDSRQARKHIYDAFTRLSMQGMWLDCGNERRAGQVLLSLYSCPAFVRQHGETSKDGINRRHEIDDEHAWKAWCQREGRPALQLPDRNHIAQSGYAITCSTLTALFPALVAPEVVTDQVPCAIRIDTQTVAANMMAAALAINILSHIADGIPMCSLGALFTTDGVCTPVQLVKVNRDRLMDGAEDFRIGAGTR